MAIEAVSAGAPAYQGSNVTSQERNVDRAHQKAAEPSENGYAAQLLTAQQQQVNSGDAQSMGEAIEKSNEKVKKAVNDLNKKMPNTSCQFGIHEGTGRVTIKIVDKETKEVIKEFPAEETLEMIEKVWELAGIMVDEKL